MPASTDPHTSPADHLCPPFCCHKRLTFIVRIVEALVWPIVAPRTSNEVTNRGPHQCVVPLHDDVVPHELRPPHPEPLRLLVNRL